MKTKKIFCLLFLSVLLASSAFAETRTNGRKVVTTAGTAVPFSASQALYHDITICAEDNNTGVVTVGGATGLVATQATRTGVFLAASDCYSPPNSRAKRNDLQNLWLNSTVSGDGVTYESILED